MEKFKIDKHELQAVELAETVARMIVAKRSTTPGKIVGLGKALIALDRMPYITPGVSVEFTIYYRSGNEESKIMNYIGFLISDSIFEISKGGSVYNKNVGSDSFSEPSWLIEAGGRSSFDEIEFYDFIDGVEASVSEYLKLGAEVLVSDDSDDLDDLDDLDELENEEEIED